MKLLFYRIDNFQDNKKGMSRKITLQLDYIHIVVS